MGEAVARYAAPIALVALFVVFFIATPKFLTTSNMTALFVSAAILVVMSMGQQLVITVAGIDLSVGSNLPWAATVIGWTWTHGWGTPAAIAAGILAGLVVGLVNGLLVARLKMADFIVTLGSLSVVSGLTLLLTGGNQTAVSSGFLQGLALNGIGPIRWFWLVAVVVAAIAAYLLFWTRTGTYLLSTGGNLEAARDVGIPVNRVRLLAYAGSGLACGIAGVLFVSNNGGSDPTMQTNLLLSSIAAVVLGGSSLSGGRASILGTAAGAVLLQTLLNGFTLLDISQYYQPIAVGVVVLGAAFISRFQR
ncbi:ABC transporter permease [Flexivirga caeni]|uniref:ABC transporter permease n=2 Tax=Flexivirga caeni TaxID=2294115 RepID=A0A3M9M3Q5_9MICO|nr:ABC transporter permease [Flexivirga caeni]